MQVKATIATDLANGTWKPGEKLPTEGELSKHFDVSEGTVRLAVIDLVKEGRLTRRSGKGTFVARPNFDRSFERFYRFRGGQNESNPEYGVRAIGLKRDVAADSTIAKALNVGARTKILSIHRTIEQNGVVVCHSTSYLRQDRFGGLVEADFTDTALYDVLQTKFGVYIMRVVENLSARVARADDCAILNIPKKSPVIAIERVAYTYSNEVVEIRRTVARSDKFNYQIELT